MNGADPATPMDGGEPPEKSTSGPWILKVRYSGAAGKHSAQPLHIDDVVIINLGLPPESDPRRTDVNPESMETTAFLTEDEMPATGLDIDFEVFRIVQAGESWNVISD